MRIEDLLRGGGLTREDFDALDQRVSNLEAAAQGDGAAVPSIYTINKAGEVSITENTTIVEAPEVEEGEGDLLIVEGGKTRRLKPGPAGDILSSTGKKLKWIPPPGGGGVKVFKPPAASFAEAEWGAEEFGTGGSAELEYAAAGFTEIPTLLFQLATASGAKEPFIFNVTLNAVLAGNFTHRGFSVWSSVKQPKGTKVKFYWMAFGN